MERSRRILAVSKRLLVFTGVSLLLTAVLFLLAFYFQRFPVSWFCFECGIIGGFVSIQQRLKEVGDEELEYLGQSWTAILMIPVFGGVFSLVLYLLFLSGIVESALFRSQSVSGKWVRWTRTWFGYRLGKAGSPNLLRFESLLLPNGRSSPRPDYSIGSGQTWQRILGEEA